MKPNIIAFIGAVAVVVVAFLIIGFNDIFVPFVFGAIVYLVVDWRLPVDQIPKPPMDSDEEEETTPALKDIPKKPPSNFMPWRRAVQTSPPLEEADDKEPKQTKSERKIVKPVKKRLQYLGELDPNHFSEYRKKLMQEEAQKRKATSETEESEEETEVAGY